MHQIETIYKIKAKEPRDTHLIYKGLGAVASMRLFLSTISDNLYERYDFNVGKKSNGQDMKPTFRDVLVAYYNPSDSNYSKRSSDDNNELSDFFTEDEWEYLIGLNAYVDFNLPSQLEMDDEGRIIVVVNNDFYHKDIIEVISVKSWIVKSVDKLVVKNAGMVSPFSTP